MSEKIIRIKSGNEEITMNVTEEEYRNYFRPWWQMKKREQRNREAMEQNGYTEESYEEWKENDMRTELFAESMEELAEKRMLLDVLQDAMDSLLPEEQELIGILQAISIVAKSLAAKLMQIEKEVEAYEAAKAAAYCRMACEQGFLPVAPTSYFRSS